MDGALDGDGDVDLPVEVSQGEVTGRKEPGARIAGPEDEQPGRLEVPPVRGDDPDPLRQPRHPGAQGAGAGDDQIDPHPPLGGPVEGVDDLAVDEPVDLEADAAGRAGRRLPPDQLQEAPPEVARPDQELSETGRAAVAGQVVEQVGQVGGDVGIGRQQRHTLGAAGGMVQPRPHDPVARHPGAGVADHQRDGAMGP